MKREEVFGDDYLYFYSAWLTDELSDTQVERIWALLELEEGLEVLDLACGHGRIANRLAVRGARVTGLDATPRFLELAREDAAARGVEVEYVEGDMRSLPWEARFDRVVLWFTSFGYFDDDENRQVLREVARALRPGGRFLVDVNNLALIIRERRPFDVVQHEGNFLIDETYFDLPTGRMEFDRVVVREGETRRTSFAVRMFMAPELSGWLRDAGFSAVDVYDNDGRELLVTSRRMVLVAHR